MLRLDFSRAVTKSLGIGDRIGSVVFDKGSVEMIPKKGSASALKGFVKWRGRPATLSQMDEAIARETCYNTRHGDKA